MKNKFCITVQSIPILLIISIISGQTGSYSGLRYGQYDTQIKNQDITTEIQELDLSTIALEQPIDPEEYLIGPGDKFGINIVSSTNSVFAVAVGPSGDLLIPTVGVIALSGLTLKESLERLNQKIAKYYKNAQINTTLVSIRVFRIQTIGAVNIPGFVTISPVDRVMDVLKKAGGLHKYADEENIQIENNHGKSIRISLKDYFRTGDLVNNPTLKENDRIYVSFLETYKQDINQFATFHESAVAVTGHVKFPGAYRYIPGFSIMDYVGLAGGVLETGTMRNLQIIKGASKIKAAPDDYIDPGSLIYVSENFRYRVFGQESILVTIRNIATMYLTYIAATKK